jgi:hypothetical protein
VTVNTLLVCGDGSSFAEMKVENPDSVAVFPMACLIFKQVETGTCDKLACVLELPTRRAMNLERRAFC